MKRVPATLLILAALFVSLTALCIEPQANESAKLLPSDWKEPARVLEDISFENATMAEVAETLTRLFPQQITVLVPQAAAEEKISLKIENKVSASEIFLAMNKLYEASGTKRRWELSMIGRHPTATLRLLDAETAKATPAASKPARAIIYIGDLVEDGTSANVTLAAAVDICGMADPHYSPKLRFHEATQVVVVEGKEEEIKLFKEAIDVLKDRAVAERNRRNAAAKPAKP